MSFKPNLFIPGFAKCGTSYLHEILNDHEDISMSKVKETHNFVLDDNFDNIENSDFENNFKEMFKKSVTQFRGESSTLNIMHSDFIRRIYFYCEAPKFIILVRDPIERVVSHFNWMKYLGNVNLSFQDEISQDIGKPFDTKINYDGNYKNYILFSSYYKNLLNIKKYFPDSFLIVNIDSLDSDFYNTIDSICRFLNINNTFVNVNNKKSNETPKVIRSNKPFIFSFLCKLLSNKVKDYLKILPFIKKGLTKFQNSEYFYKPKEQDKRLLFDLLHDDILCFKNEYPDLVSQWNTTNHYLNSL